MEIIKQCDSDPEDFYSKQSELRTVKKQEKIRKMRTCSYDSRKRKIVRSDGMVFNSVLEASNFCVEKHKAKNMKSAKSTINAALRGETISAFGYSWKVLEQCLHP